MDALSLCFAGLEERRGVGLSFVECGWCRLGLHLVRGAGRGIGLRECALCECVVRVWSAVCLHRGVRDRASRHRR